MKIMNPSGSFAKLRQRALAGAALAALLAPLTPPASAETWQDWINQKTLTGNWNGGRTRLADVGITFKGGYVGEFADVLSGGKRQGNGYAQQFYYGVRVDLGKLAGIDGMALNVGFNTRQGRSVSSDFIGNQLAVQEVYGAGETTRVTELSLEQALLHKQLQLKIGFYPMGNDFGVITDGCDFQNVGFCAHAQNLPSGTSGWADNPQGRWGGRVEYSFTPQVAVLAGVFESNPTYTEHGNGLKVSTSGATGANFVGELQFKPEINDLPGDFRVGGYYDTTKAADVTNSKELDNGRYGVYAIAHQMLVSFGGDKRGLIGLAMVSYSDPTTAKFRASWLGGLIAQGPFASRPADFIDVGYVRAIVNQRLVNEEEKANPTLTDLSTGEGVLEAGYGVQATGWMSVQPNVQYIMDPGTFSYKHIPNAWVFGVQTKINF